MKKAAKIILNYFVFINLSVIWGAHVCHEKALFPETDISCIEIISDDENCHADTPCQNESLLEHVFENQALLSGNPVLKDIQKEINHHNSDLFEGSGEFYLIIRDNNLFTSQSDHIHFKSAKFFDPRSGRSPPFPSTI